VSRCFGCASEETFAIVEQADKFRVSILRAIGIFTIGTFLKTLTVFYLGWYEMFETQDQIDFVIPALDCTELLFVTYMAYCMNLFSSCLSQGLLYEYQPKAKFALLAALSLIVVSQRFIIYLIIGMSYSTQMTLEEQS